MLEELHTASNLLRAALERYIRACSALQNGCSLKNKINSAIEISLSVHDELNLLTAYKCTLGQAEVAVKNARNNLASVPVNTLPPEVLTHIFHIVLAQQLCRLQSPFHWNSGNPAHLPTYPDVFTHVCSRWRRIALSSHTLWSHIDIRLSCKLSKGFHARAETYVARAHQAPLDIHFIDSSIITETEGNDDDDDWYEWDSDVHFYNPQEFTFLAASSRPRIRSLGLLISEEYHVIHSRALEHCLVNCFPGSLSELAINLRKETSNLPFFETSLGSQHQDSASSTRFLSSLSEQQLENAWRSTTTLFLQYKYPRWSSAAYHGLIDLRLLGRQEISELELTGILTSSPGLRILHCDLDIHDSTPLSDLTPFVALQELEVLNLKDMDKANTERFFRWLKPGPKPLRLSLSGDPTFALLNDFYARSNVQEMRVTAKHQQFGEHLLPLDLLFLPPQLRTLVMIDRGNELLERRHATSTSLGLHEALPMELDTLYMLGCRYDKFSEFRHMVEKYSPRRLILWECRIGHPYLGSSRIDMRFLESALGNHLPELCASIECPTDCNYSSFLWDSY